jgi:cation:H+ antiporter
MKFNWRLRIAIAILCALPALVSTLLGVEYYPVLSALIFGASIVSAAFILTWAAETAQMDISASFAIAILALIAVLPEYGVDIYFSYIAGKVHEYTHYAAANMTGSNRLLIGFGWTTVVFVYVISQRRKGNKIRKVILAPKRRIELFFLILASIYCFIIPFKKSISLLDAFFLLSLFVLYMYRVSREAVEEPHLIGTAAGLATLPKKQRQLSVLFLFLLAILFVFVGAKPFAHSLIDTGKLFGINEFLLVQWVAPLATEAPEFIVAILLALRAKGDAGLGTLLSSKVNQWTLLIGSIPIAYFIGGGGFALPLDLRQNHEFILTAAQTGLGIAILLNLKFNVIEAIILLCLFLLQFFFTGSFMRDVFAYSYIAISLVLLATRMKELNPILQKVFHLDKK